MMVDVNGIVEIKDFSFSPDPKRFKINNDVFEMAPVFPLGLIENIGKYQKLGSDPSVIVPAIIEFLDELFLPHSSQLFKERLDNKTIGFQHIMPIFNWVLEVYGLRPTQQSLPSSDESQDETSTSSMDGAAAAVSVRLD
jgi:hypothetical protein